MSDLEHIKARIAEIMADLKAHPEKLAELEARADRGAAMVREFAAALYARKPPVPDERGVVRPITGANRPRRKPIDD